MSTPPVEPDTSIGTDTAWKVHEALSSWTGRVDSKASIVLTLEVAALGFVIALTDGTKLFGDLTGWRDGAFKSGLVLLGLGILAALAVVCPQLSRRQASREWKEGLIYFGHLRRWDPEDLQQRLGSLRDADVQASLAVQLVTMSKIAWRKHTLLQASVLCGTVAAALFVLAGLP
jgi:hypothetical protein